MDDSYQRGSSYSVILKLACAEVPSECGCWRHSPQPARFVLPCNRRGFVGTRFRNYLRGHDAIFRLFSVFWTWSPSAASGNVMLSLSVFYRNENSISSAGTLTCLS